MISEELPEGWSLTTIDEITTKVGSGATPKGGSLAYADSGVPLIRSMNVHFGGFKPDGLVYLNDKQAQLLKEVTVHEDDVLLNITGASIGRVCRAPREMAGSRVNQHVCIIRLIGAVLPAYLSSYLSSPTVQEMIWGEEYGVTRQALTKGQILSFQIPTPPLAEQRRIVAAVERILAAVSAARARLDRVPTTLKRFRQAVLAAACSGRLTEDWRLSESSYPAQERVSHADNENFCHEIPTDWVWMELQTVCSKITDGEHLTPPRAAAGVPLLSAKDVRDTGLDFSDTKYVTESFGAQSRQRCDPEYGDMLVVSRGATVGRCCRIDTDRVFCLMGSVLLFKLRRGIVLPSMMEFVFKSPRGLDELTSRSGASAQQAIYIRDMRSFAVPVPPLAEQQEIVRRVSALFARADAIEAAVAAARKRVDALTHAVLAKAFRGELVPTEAELARRENRPYEPAADLLARVRAATPAPAKPGRTRKAKPPASSGAHKKA